VNLSQFYHNTSNTLYLNIEKWNEIRNTIELYTIGTWVLWVFGSRQAFYWDGVEGSVHAAAMASLTFFVKESSQPEETENQKTK
jgi:hypothetical protein